MTQTYSIINQLYYNSITQCYQKILVIDRKPIGPLQNIVKTLHTPKLSPFQYATPCSPLKLCSLAIYNPYNKSELLSPHTLPILISFLQNNGYTINSQLTHTLCQQTNNIIFYISY